MSQPDHVTLTWVDDLPPAKRPNAYGQAGRLLAALRENPGRWAEVAKYPLAERNAAYNRGSYHTRKHSDIEHAVRTIDGQAILFMRAVPR